MIEVCRIVYTDEFKTANATASAISITSKILLANALRLQCHTVATRRGACMYELSTSNFLGRCHGAPARFTLQQIELVIRSVTNL